MATVQGASGNNGASSAMRAEAQQAKEQNKAKKDAALPASTREKQPNTASSSTPAKQESQTANQGNQSAKATQKARAEGPGKALSGSSGQTGQKVDVKA
ncbi:MAG: hypothetical protein HY280_08000 [Nitrospinae bacterium]|nr:hypothetical protein [Nitrospinota bacterium]